MRRHVRLHGMNRFRFGSRQQWYFPKGQLETRRALSPLWGRGGEREPQTRCVWLPLSLTLSHKGRGDPAAHRRGLVNQSAHAEEIALADFDAVVAQDAVGGSGVEVEVREREIVQEPLSLQGNGGVGADREGDVLGVATLELRRLERLDIVDGLGEPLPQFLKGLF